MQHIIKIPIGDWSNDGHGQYKVFTIKSNYPVLSLQEAYKASCKLTGLQFNHGDNYAELPNNRISKNKRHICTEYGESTISDVAREIFAEFGCPSEVLVEEGYFEGTKDFTKTLLWFISLSMPDDFTYKFEEVGNYLNGFWNENLNVQFGYGLFY
ncbi:hypothetical protein ABE137_12035 [Brevibacillus laterosporus]|uniref:hypothetical protein n=1 Tax=Brevibacillus phage Sundance TaxID=1691958 RepID=UPI0006BC3D8C|nr:hypothetical protein AVT09_gp075 [Brevibacillus phage Sundance]ALA47891.1 hypothetical protein SUNDANCE_75 [Brevibacillus phage Sundance]